MPYAARIQKTSTRSVARSMPRAVMQKMKRRHHFRAPRRSHTGAQEGRRSTGESLLSSAKYAHAIKVVTKYHSRSGMHILAGAY